MFWNSVAPSGFTPPVSLYTRVSKILAGLGSIMGLITWNTSVISSHTSSTNKNEHTEIRGYLYFCKKCFTVSPYLSLL